MTEIQTTRQNELYCPHFTSDLQEHHSLEIIINNELMCFKLLIVPHINVLNNAKGKNIPWSTLSTYMLQIQAY